MKHLISVIALIGFFIFVPNVYADIFFIDADCLTPGNGSTATCANDGNDSFDDTLDFTETGRSAGDIAIHRRGTTALYDDGTDLEFTSDGTISNPIFLEADYDDNWGDFASSSQTYTPTFGSKTMTASATITGISVNNWVYFDAEDQREFAYEVSAVSGTTLTLFLPYKGAITGSGNTLDVMPDAPIWNTTTGNIQWNFNGDNFWKVQGIHIRGTDINGNVEIDSSINHEFIDVIFEGDSSTISGLEATDDTAFLQVHKSRFVGHSGASIEANEGLSALWGIVKDSKLEDDIQCDDWCINFLVEESEFESTDVIVSLFGNDPASFAFVRNVLFNDNGVNITRNVQVFFEDYNGVVGDNQYFRANFNGALATIKSTTTPVRSGGGATSIEVLPSTGMSTAWKHSRLQLFEYPIYTDTTSRDYQVFFKAGTSTGAFTVSPTANELWIECEYWGTSSSPNHRRLLKSTATMDFTTDSDFDQSLTITCNPSQTGILYLRAFYAKTKETGRINEFFVDPRPVITDT